MVYLDYSATTQTSDEVLDTFVKASKFIGNPNSLHKLGIESKKLIDTSTKQIADLLGCKEEDIIYTSGSSESNNLAIKGIAEKYPKRGKKIITTDLEHSSIYGPLSYLQKKEYEVIFAKLDENGQIDLKELEKIMDDDVLLVTISAVNSETGVTQELDKIAKICKKYPKCFFHTDMTQSIGKDIFDKNKLKDIDLISFSAHKFFGIKGIGCLIKRGKISLEPLIHGGKSTTAFRSGTPAVALIASLAKALRIALEDNKKRYDYVKKLNEEIKENLKKYDNVSINSNEKCIPQILNLSVLNIKPETFQHALEEDEIYISTQSACASGHTKSRAVYALTRDDLKAEHSIRISLSYKTTEEEVQKFLKAFDKQYKKLNLK